MLFMFHLHHLEPRPCALNWISERFASHLIDINLQQQRIWTNMRTSTKASEEPELFETHLSFCCQLAAAKSCWFRMTHWWSTLRVNVTRVEWSFNWGYLGFRKFFGSPGVITSLLQTLRWINWWKHPLIGRRYESQLKNRMKNNLSSECELLDYRDTASIIIQSGNYGRPGRSRLTDLQQLLILMWVWRRSKVRKHPPRPATTN